METNNKKCHLRLIIGGKAAAPREKVMTEIGPLDEQPLAVWRLVRKVPIPVGAWPEEDVLAEGAQVTVSDGRHGRHRRRPAICPASLSDTVVATVSCFQ